MVYVIEILVAVVLLFITFVGMAYFAWLEKSRINFVKSDCIAMDTLTAEEALFDYLKPNKNQIIGLMNCFCKAKHEQVGDEIGKIVFSDGQSHCTDWLHLEDMDYSSFFLLTILVAFTNMIHQVIFNKLGKMYRPRYTTQINFFKTLTIFVVQYLNTAIIFVLAFNSFLFSESTIKQNKQEDYLAGPFDEFDERWFLIVGCPIGLVIIVQLFTPHLPLFFRYIYRSWKRYKDRNYTFNTRSTR